MDVGVSGSTGRRRGVLVGVALGASVLLVALLGLTLRSARASRMGGEDSPQLSRSSMLTRGPYLQSVTTDSIMIVWDTKGATDSRVDYGPTAGDYGPAVGFGPTAADDGLTQDLGISVTDPAPVTHHVVTLTGLLPYTEYVYQVSSGGTALGRVSTFRTAAPATRTGFSFVAFGDTRTNVAAHQRVVDRIVALAPDFVLHTGDLVAAGSRADQWVEFFAIEEELMRQAPVFPVLGNHEGNHANYFDAFHLPGNERWYAFDYGPVHFIGLQMDGFASYEPGSPQYEWLEKELMGNDSQWTVVFFHVPPYSSGPHADESYALGVREHLHPLFVRHGVDLVFNGHDHDHERSVVDGVTYVVAGAGGAPLYSRTHENPHSVTFTSTHHAVSVTVKGDVLSAVGVRPDGQRFDPFTLTRRADAASRRVSGPGLYTFDGVGARVDLSDSGGLTGLTATVSSTYPVGQPGVRFLPRVYTLTGAGEGDYTADLVFRYRDDDLWSAGIESEASLRLYRHGPSGRWEDWDSTVDPAGNWITATGVSSFSRWAVGEEREPMRIPIWLPVVWRSLGE